CIRDQTGNTNSPIEKGAFATILAHMGNISFRTGTRVVYDPVKRKFVDNLAADSFLTKDYRSPWKLPVV
ncbi:MAG: putative NADH-dependent dihydrogenase, partial [Sediminibacterium sp.]|nr:putative NADH-dependent dihydrogenase [Sediminibacterium sp.]